MRLIVTHSLTNLNTEKHFVPEMKISRLKDTLYSISGTRPDDMTLQLRSRDNKLICVMDSEGKSLQDYNAKEYMIVHIVDSDETKRVQQYTDVSQVKKYQISEEEYEKRDDSFRKWKSKNVKKPSVKEVVVDEKYLEKPPEEIKVGARCEVQNALKSRGEVKFLGMTKLGDGYWVGVGLDEPYGNSNGVVKGKRHFQCEAKYGLFVRFDKIKVGDYPEETFDSSDEEF